jgi:hypothetical protein
MNGEKESGNYLASAASGLLGSKKGEARFSVFSVFIIIIIFSTDH